MILLESGATQPSGRSDTDPRERGIDREVSAWADRQPGGDLPIPAEPVVATTIGPHRTTDKARLVANAFDANAEALKGFALAAVRDEATAEDLVQEAFLRLVRELDRGQPPDNPRAWLFRVCANLVVSYARRRSVSERARRLLFERSFSASPEDAVIRRDDDHALRRGLERLRPEERIVLLLSASGLSSAEVGKATGRTANASRVYLSRARVHLLEVLAAQEGGE